MCLSCSEFEFNGAQEIAALISVEGERVPLDRPVVTNSELTPGVEFWLVKTEEQMRMSLATIMHKSLQVRIITSYECRSFRLAWGTLMPVHLVRS